MPGESYRWRLASLLLYLCVELHVRSGPRTVSDFCLKLTANLSSDWLQSYTPSKLHTSPTATPLAPNFWTDKIQNCLHVLQRNHRFRSLLSFWAATPLQSFPLSPLFVRHTHAQIPTLQPQNPWLSHFLTLWPPHLEQSPPRHQALCYSLFLQKSTQDISLLRIFPLNHIVLHSHQSVQCVCMLSLIHIWRCRRGAECRSRWSPYH